ACSVPVLNYMTHTRLPVYQAHPFNLQPQLEQIFIGKTPYAELTLAHMHAHPPVWLVFYPREHCWGMRSLRPMYQLEKQVDGWQIWRRRETTDNAASPSVPARQ